MGNDVDSPTDVPIAGIIPSSKAPLGYIKTNPHTKYIIQAIEYRPIFFVTISDTSFFCTSPASSMVKPAAINMTSAPAITA